MAIGDISQLPEKSQKTLLEGIEQTKNNDKVTLVLALNYSSKWEILDATRQLASQVKDGLLKPEDITEAVFEQALTTKDIPDPELLIRTSGETRISNFLLWQISYAELWVTEKCWADFRQSELFEAFRDFGNRERRFGGLIKK